MSLSYELEGPAWDLERFWSKVTEYDTNEFWEQRKSGREEFEEQLLKRLEGEQIPLPKDLIDAYRTIDWSSCFTNGLGYIWRATYRSTYFNVDVDVKSICKSCFRPYGYRSARRAPPKKPEVPFPPEPLESFCEQLNCCARRLVLELVSRHQQYFNLFPKTVYSAIRDEFEGYFRRKLLIGLGNLAVEQVRIDIK